MATFLLSKTEDCRVILDEISHGSVLSSIKAVDWKAAREKVDESGFEHVYGSGWFHDREIKEA